MRRLLLAVALLAPLAAAAELSVDRAIIELPPDKRTADIVASNAGDTTLYVLAEGARILNPGTDAETRVTDPDPRKVGLLVTPRKFILQPGQSRVVRTQLLAPAADHDQVFRVLVKPVTNRPDAQASGVSIQLAYDVLLMQRPADARPALTIERVGSRVVVRNLGNTNALLVDGRACRDAAYENCDSLAGKRLYADAAYAFDVAADTRVVEFTYRIKDESRILRWPQ